MKISNVAAKAACDAVSALVNASSTLVMYSGTAPADSDTALSGNVALVTLPMNATAFGASIDGNPNAISTAGAIAPTAASNTGTATFFRIFNGAGTCVMQGSCGVSAASPDLVLASTSLVAGGTVTVTALTLTMPE